MCADLNRRRIKIVEQSAIVLPFFLLGSRSTTIYTVEELKWDILILQWRGIGNDLK
jgi:hypothetical protein